MPRDGLPVDDGHRGGTRPASLGDNRPLSPRTSLDLIRAQGGDAASRLWVDPAPILAGWGLAWVVGFGALYLASTRHPLVTGWDWVAVLLAVLVMAAAVSVRQTWWRGRGVAGPSRQTEAMYAWAAVLGLGSAFGVDLGLTHQGLPATLAPLLWPASALVVVGLLYLTAGIVWRDRVQYGLGVWTLVTGAASTSAGVPGNFAVLALAGGGGLLVAASLAHARTRRRRGAGRPA
ncbi:MAG TPA: hypothetical protein VNN74_06360 [Candidatus Micrarchaeia archaeon]|nr:hypothetical protein [Candidatus Micrarchaeia archaeon]